jgi:hypothetical protein
MWVLPQALLLLPLPPPPSANKQQRTSSSSQCSQSPYACSDSSLGAT